MKRQPFRLVKFAFALFYRIQRNGHDKIPALPAQGGFRLADKQVGEKRLEPQRNVVLLINR